MLVKPKGDCSIEVFFLTAAKRLSPKMFFLCAWNNARAVRCRSSETR